VKRNSTNSGISYGLSCSTKEETFEVAYSQMCHFVPERAWGRKEGFAYTAQGATSGVHGEAESFLRRRLAQEFQESKQRKGGGGVSARANYRVGRGLLSV